MVMNMSYDLYLFFCMNFVSVFCISMIFLMLHVFVFPHVLNVFVWLPVFDRSLWKPLPSLWSVFGFDSSDLRRASSTALVIICILYLYLYLCLYLYFRLNWIADIISFHKIYSLRGTWGLGAVLQLIYELRKNCCGRDGTGRRHRRFYKRSSRT